MSKSRLNLSWERCETNAFFPIFTSSLEKPWQLGEKLYRKRNNSHKQKLMMFGKPMVAVTGRWEFLCTKSEEHNWRERASVTPVGFWSRAPQTRCRYRVTKHSNEKPNTSWVRSRAAALPLHASRSICNIWTWVNHLTKIPCKLVSEERNPNWLW